MVDLVKNNILKLQDACRRYHVKTLYLIGSATNADHFSIHSDIDFLYTFQKSEIPELEYADNYFDLLFSLQDLFQRKIDLVPEEKLSNPYFFASINKQKEFIYAS
jgi:predicted nucleotidyltransferase